MEGIGHQVGDQLEPVLAAKFASLPSNEIEAALLAVVDGLGGIDLSDDALLEVDADPEVLARRVRAEVPVDSGLSELAGRLYDVALDQACRYLIQVIRHLPAFQPRALAEVLGRASAQTAQLDDVLSRLPRTSLLAPQGVDNDDEFREEYFRHLAATLDRVELLGLSMRNRPKLALSVAYLSLSVSGDRSSVGLPDHQGRARVEASLSAKTLVRGDAGSGKTTLLDWLAVTAARDGFTGPLQKWNGLVPLPIRLRAYADSPLPRPEQFLDLSAATIAGLMPPGWVHRQLKSGQALVMVDGVDEVPQGKRHRVREWLGELCTTFPSAKVVVTSRPAAADERWLIGQGFTSVSLEQMGPADVKAFLERWHEAARDADSLPCPISALPAAQRRLVSQLDSREHLRGLASNPLLCAMLCALNLGRTSELPHNRMDLYQAALGMLLKLRDTERGIPGLLTTAEKMVFLRDLAWRLSLGNRSQLPTTKIRQHVERKVDSMPNTNAEPGSVVTDLLERSGVIREPVHGQVDFVHRTFQEYLAAAEAVQDGQIETLVGHAHLDAWSQIVVMACGHAQRSQVGELLTGILDRADDEPIRARRLRLVAAACLETVSDMDPAVFDRVDQMIRERLVPPRSIRETNSLATIGHHLLPYLPNDITSLTKSAAAAVVRATALVNNPDSLAKLTAYAPDPRPEVQRELAKAWNYFSPEAYAREVLAGAPLNAGSIEVGNLDQVPYLSLLRNLRKINVSLIEPQQSLEFLSSTPAIRMIHLSLHGEIDLTPMANQPKIRTVIFHSAKKYTGLETLSSLTNISTLVLFQLETFDDLSFVNGVKSLKHLGVSDTKSPVNFIDLQILQQLTELTILGGPVDLTHFSELSNLKKIKLVAMKQPVNLSPLAGSSLKLTVDRGAEHLGLDDLGPGVTIDWR